MNHPFLLEEAARRITRIATQPSVMLNLPFVQGIVMKNMSVRALKVYMTGSLKIPFTMLSLPGSGCAYP
jgi:hypothetical protein